jgi:hypothetical protein
MLETQTHQIIQPLEKPLEAHMSGRLMELYIGSGTDKRTREAIKRELEDRGWRLCQGTPYSSPVWTYPPPQT